MQKYNYLTVLEQVKKNSRNYYKVQCDCGKIEVKRCDWVVSGRTTRCKSCSCKETAKNYPLPINRKGCQGLSGTHFLSIKNGAARRNLVFQVTAEYLWQLYTQQQGLCALTGLPIVLVPKIKQHNVNWDIVTASLDRIDNSLGYIEGNLWWVHKEVNRFKNDYSMQQLLTFCKLILNQHGNPEPSSVNEIKVTEKVQRLDGEDSTNNPSTSAQHPKQDDDIV